MKMNDLKEGKHLKVKVEGYWHEVEVVKDESVNEKVFKKLKGDKSFIFEFEVTDIKV